jgi:hypothetical protein
MKYRQYVDTIPILVDHVVARHVTADGVGVATLTEVAPPDGPRSGRN